ncbi:class I SAM-dependent methyltransferase [Flammeovirga kamogawensis]|uniref:Class I SAM-dependent methyltransferase n=1 Tax=Flammeovirga kamogawensis TaxID=373891 RepID=A0ABX8GS93_9BACT|nr:class I SAM-dependent methyltransferase [Flammeovirga kamogawensis]MBB6462730.1 ubiquinone/menaquinone biosynthesis C-methylase UbiE [Flammeovirga kamogawensis]QWG06037.1 class I SAM-dependent methyltransferase [Flammeovirga kamogawensis]TRX67869.1 class I SAM-dependent methyltransferase [Flammeovirga kamogawensis]
MSDFDKKAHWENIYTTKALENVSWYQRIPITSLDFIDRATLTKDNAIIDVGGGDSFLIDHLLDLSYTDLSVLDISKQALLRAQKRLGAEKAAKINWIEADASNFKSQKKFDLWHDRAAFHFLTDETEIENYVKTVKELIKTDGIIVIGTFSENGPTKCSGIPIKQYSVTELAKVFEKDFELINTQIIDHKTPFNTVQNFSFCCLRKR